MLKLLDASIPCFLMYCLFLCEVWRTKATFQVEVRVHCMSADLLFFAVFLVIVMSDLIILDFILSNSTDCDAAEGVPVV